MREVSTGDLRAAAAVLRGNKSLADAASEYTVQEAVVTAVAILWLAGWRRPRFQGEFGLLLEQLAVEPGVPADRWSGQTKPHWYYSKAFDQLVPMSRQLRTHRSGDHGRGGLTLDPPTDIRELAIDAAFVAKAKELYAAAVEAIAFRRLCSKVQGNVVLSEWLWPLIQRCSTLADIREHLAYAGELADSYLPSG